MSDAGISTCPICERTWTVTPLDDCLMPACGHYGTDSSAANPNRPCHRCGLKHAWMCKHGEEPPERTVTIGVDDAFEDAVAAHARQMNDVPKMKLFGSKWAGTPIAEECELVPTPVDSLCFKCSTRITATQSGVLMWTVMKVDEEDFRGYYAPWHRICLALDVLGVIPPELEER